MLEAVFVSLYLGMEETCLNLFKVTNGELDPESLIIDLSSVFLS